MEDTRFANEVSREDAKKLEGIPFFSLLDIERIEEPLVSYFERTLKGNGNEEDVQIFPAAVELFTLLYNHHVAAYLGRDPL